MSQNGSRSVRTAFFTALALIAFAANSVLCRLALGAGEIDAASFTSVRLVSGIVVLAVLVGVRRKPSATIGKGSWIAGVMLFLYAVTFSYAYTTLETGTGALVLFGTVQITMVVASFITGARLHISEWAGLALAVFGFLYLILPQVSSPSLVGFALMACAGVTTAIYTLLGRASQNPLQDNFYNFLRTTPLVVLLTLVTLNQGHYSFDGILYAVISGAAASGVAYALWYSALRHLSGVQAGALQLLVPVIAAFGGVVFVSEPLTLPLLISALFILGGILALTVGKHYFSTR